jgi:hypothetical protein
MLRRVALARTDVSEERSASYIRVTKTGAVGTTLAVTSNRSTVRLLVTSDVAPRRLCLEGPHRVTSQMTPFFWYK